MSNQKTTAVVFNGKASEYFGIWIVNLLLTLVTFGIYSAWAKVRRKKYFYNNILVDNVGFDYHAKPIAILKGRVIAFAFFIAYSLSGQFNPFIPGALMLIFFIALPWLVVRYSMFNARNTSHRGLRFDFVGKVGEAFRVFFLLPIITMFTLGLAVPFASHQRNKFLMDNHKFGMSQFNMQATVKSFYKVYWIVILVPLIAIIGILAAIAIPAYHQYQLKAQAAGKHAEISLPYSAGFVDIQAPQSIVLAENEALAEMPKAEMKKIERVYSDNAPPAPVGAAEAPVEAPAATTENMPHNEANMTIEERNFAMEEGLPMDKTTVQAAMQARQAEDAQMEGQQDRAQESQNQEGQNQENQADSGQAKEKTLEEMMAEREKAKQEKLKEMFTNPAAFMGFLGFMLGYLVFIFGFLAYIQARIGNLVWNNTALDRLTFQSSLRARDFIWLYISNIIAIICTFGLATPWAQIRLARYRASKLQVVGDVDFDQFVGDKKAEMKATGEEIADFFDVDLSFG